MPTQTYFPLANFTATGSSASVTFSSIPSSYRDIVIVFNGGAVSGTHNLLIAFNSDTTSGNYLGLHISGTGSGGETGTAAVRFLNYYGYLEGNLNCVIVSSVLDYSATDKHKTYLSRSNAGANGVSAVAGRWANTAAITSINLSTGANFASGTTIALYGISG